MNPSTSSRGLFSSLSLGKQNISDVIKKIHKEISDKIRVNNLRTVLNEVLRLTYYDFEFAEDEYPEHLVKNLCEIINLFQKKETGMERFQQLILEKATFLLSKALFCYDENERSELFVMFEGEKKICEKLLESVKVSERSKDLISLINLYEKENLDEQEVKKLRSLKQKFSGNKLLQAYIDVKIYKDSKNLDFSQPDLVLNSLNKIQKLNDNLEEETGDDVSIFDEVSIKVNKIFILNKLISLADELLVHFNKQKGLSFSNKSNEFDCIYELVKKAMNQIEEIENSPKNYFTYYKYSKFLYSYYIYRVQNNNITENKQNLPEVPEIEKYAKIASDILYKLEKFQRYRLSYEGSFIHIGKEKVFIYSSINLLFNYFGQRSLIEVQNIKANTIEVHRKMQDITQKSKENVKKDMEKTKEDTKNQTQKEVNRMTQNVVGLLGIFSAVITFSFGSIQLFRHLTDFSQAFILMSLFAFSTIITFLCVMHIVYQKKDWKSLICTIIIILTATLVFF